MGLSKVLNNIQFAAFSTITVNCAYKTDKYSLARNQTAACRLSVKVPCQHGARASRSASKLRHLLLALRVLIFC